MGDDDVTNCCHGDLVFEITSNGKGGKRGGSLVESRRENEKKNGRGGKEKMKRVNEKEH